MGLAAPVAAIADVEPNNGITQVEGPVAGGVVYAGVHATNNDPDWYQFYAASQTQLDISVTVPGDSPSCSHSAYLVDSDGDTITSVSTSPNETDHILRTTEVGVNRYILVFSTSCAGSKYQFRLDPAGSIVSGPGLPPVTSLGEPNESAVQAIGPLAGGIVYGSGLETSNDSDWFFFYSSGATPFDMAVTTATGCGIRANLYGGDGTTSVGSVFADVDNTTHLTHTPSGPAKFLLSISASSWCAGTTYQLRIDPPAALAPVLPPPPPAPKLDHCTPAKVDAATWKVRVKATKRKLRAAHRPSRRRALRRKLAKQQRALGRARSRVTLRC